MILTRCLQALAECRIMRLTWLDALNEVSIVHKLGVQPDGKGVQRLAIAVCFTTPFGAHLRPHAMLTSSACPGPG